jgi:multidrug efflux system membrane fusion protein
MEYLAAMQRGAGSNIGRSPVDKNGQLMMMRTVHTLIWLGLALCAFFVGCRTKQSAAPPSAAPPFPVSHPVEREVTDFVDFTGRTDAVESVGVRARVTGYVEAPHFQEGTEVAKDQTLFVIDPRPYQAQYNQAKSQVAVNDASLKLAKATLARDEAVNQSAAGAVSAQQLDTDRATVLVAEAQLDAAKANMVVYDLNLKFTNVTSPISGMVSRYYYTEGNLVVQDSTLLTTIVSLDPMYAYFDLDETTLVRIRQGIVSGRIKRFQNRSDIPIYFGLQGEDGFPHQSTFNFINNVVNPSTGSISTRVQFPNPKSPEGVRLFSPGMFVRIHLPLGQPHKALLVIDRAISSDQGNKFVYVMDPKTRKLQYRRITTGPLQSDGLRAVEESTKLGEGLTKDDWVVVGGLPQVRPQMVIRPDEEPMPTLAGEVQPESPGTSPAAPSKSTAAPATTAKPPVQPPASTGAPRKNADRAASRGALLQ